MSAKEKPYCESGPRWVRERLKDKTALAPLTGQDWRAFKAFFHLVALWGACDEPAEPHVVAAMYHTLQAMQSNTRHLAKAGIPHVLDWSHEDAIWLAVQQYAATAQANAEAVRPPQWMFGRAGIDVVVQRDNGERLETATRSIPWQLGHGQWVIAVDGISGGYDVARVSRR